jgi:hypothetical protein
MTCPHSPSSKRVALHEGLCPRCLYTALSDLVDLIKSPGWRQTEIAAYTAGYECPPEIAQANAETIARAKELLK